ncbi:hypothetical protein BH10PLA2_BH10PLA2_23500 [soil metagenome]
MLRRRYVLLQLLAVFVLASSGSLVLAQPTTPPAPQSEKAKLKVFAPADAILTVDGAQTQSTGEIRNFESPLLPPGKKYVYTLRATWKEKGREVERERIVRVEAGVETTVDFRMPEPTVTSDKDVGVIPLPVPADVVEKMLELADAKKTDVICDPKCGDGQALITAAKKLGARGIGYEGESQQINDAVDNVKKNNVANLVSIQRSALPDVDLKDATVVMLHLVTGGNARVYPQLVKLKPGVRIVSDNSDLKGARPTRKISYMAKGDKPGEAKEHTLYLWVVPWDRE